MNNSRRFNCQNELGMNELLGKKSRENKIVWSLEKSKLMLSFLSSPN